MVPKSTSVKRVKKSAPMKVAKPKGGPKKSATKSGQAATDDSIAACLALVPYKTDRGMASNKVDADREVVKIRTPPPALQSLVKGGEWGKAQMQAVTDFLKALQKEHGDNVTGFVDKYKECRGPTSKRAFAEKLALARDTSDLLCVQNEWVREEYVEGQ